ncbi:MAG TPA: cell division protein FtsZ [Caldisericia bacterium]|nr:cell division protein FtsZ [Caldisericia bacterium]OQB70442.1 MAG: Cell division protein FtsZ [bacterium ADurb.Bin132]HNW31820.1 cell division protein FtsZ [Caldisericia bacterium]HNY61159.1 cell division protein FtsZ [Caldisericia bacterium]HOC79131.1 cell division protein FtsZ [Caldisericia bacterium]
MSSNAFDVWEGSNALIKVVGIGGGGNNAVNRMIECGLEGVEFISINTDTQTLRMSQAPSKIQIGPKVTRGLGAGSIPDLGEKSAEESKDIIAEMLSGAHLIFVTAGMGGGTGTGAIPVVAQIARDLGALTIAIVTKPFSFEGERRMNVAEGGIEKLKDKVDAMICINNDRLFDATDRNTSLTEAFLMVDEVLRQAVEGITTIITVPGLVNVDFADVRTIMKDAGTAWMGIGTAKGESRAEEAAKMAISSPLLDHSLEGAKGLLCNTIGGKDFKISEANDVARYITKNIDSKANIVWGAVIDPKMEDQLKVIVIATGFSTQPQNLTIKTPTIKEGDLKNLVSNKRELDIPPFLRKKQQ